MIWQSVENFKMRVSWHYYIGIFWKSKDWILHFVFNRATLSTFAMRESTTKEGLNTMKQVFCLLALETGLPKNKNIELFSMKKIFIKKIFLLLKLSVFCFEINSFCFPDCCISFILQLLQLVYGIQSMTQFYFAGAHLAK